MTWESGSKNFVLASSLTSENQPDEKKNHLSLPGVTHRRRTMLFSIPVWLYKSFPK